MRRARGFTLIELLVALAILGLVGALLVSSVGMGRRVWARFDRRGGELRQVEAAQMVLRDRLEAIVPLTRYDADAPYADIEGKADVLFFVAPAAPERQPDALASYRLSLSTTDELVLSSTSEIARERDPPRDDRVLLKGVERVELGYFGVAPPDGVARWRDRWYHRPTPPPLIRVRVLFKAGDRRVWPDLMVHPVATRDTQCVLNSVSGRCKGR